MPLHALLIEDDTAIAAMLCTFLGAKDIKTTAVHNAQQAREVLQTQRFDAVILDIGLPDGDGLSLCGEIHTRYALPVIMSTAQRAIDTKLAALQGCAADYLTKPYDPRELLARLHLVLGRTPEQAEKVGAFHLDDVRKVIHQHQQRLNLTGAEYEILRLMIVRSGHVVSRTEIANSIESHRLESDVQSINVLISRIRKKIGADHIVTLRGLGYRFVP